MSKGVKIALCVGLAFVFIYWLAPADLTQSQRLVQGVVVLAVGLWLTDAVPAFAVGILVIFLSVMLLSFAGGASSFPLSVLYNTWSSPIIFLLLGGFFLAQAVTIVGLDQRIVGLALKIFGSKPRNLLLGIMATSGLLSMLMSNTATTALMLGSAAPLIDKLGAKHPYAKSILLGIATAAAVGGIGTVIGSPPNAIAISALAAQNRSINFVQWMKYGFPLAIALILIAWLVIIRFFPLPSGVVLDKLHLEPHQATVGYKHYLTVVTLLLTLGLWLTTPFHGFHVAAIASVPIVVFTLTGVLGPADLKRLPWDTLMLVAGGLTLGEALNRTGLAEYYVQKLDLSTLNPLAVILVFGYLSVLVSNVMSNTATASLLMPLGMKLVPGHTLDIAMTTGICASFAILLPVSTPPNAIVFSTGYLKQSDFRITGLIVGLVGPLLTLLYLRLI